MSRLLIKDLEILVMSLNAATGSPAFTWKKLRTGKLVSNVGNFHLERAYGMVKLVRIVDKGGCTKDIIGFGTKKETYLQIRAFLAGVRL